MMSLIARWFEPATAPQDYRNSDYYVLFLIVAVGAILRFWGLGNVGLHGDEETMAMPAMAILDSGQPLLPSGMYYPRGLIQIYLMSGSVLLFGESEWAFRVPSAIVGSLAVLAAFFMGRRFLAPEYNLAFVATIALLPDLISTSQTARMYIFFIACVIWFAACVFRWERDQRLTSLAMALLVWILALHFQRLAIFAALLFLFPGLSRQSWKLLMQGAGAFAAGWFLFDWYSAWTASKYPDHPDRPPAQEESIAAPLDALVSVQDWFVIGSLVAIATLVILLLVKVARRGSWSQAMPVLLTGMGLAAIAGLQYHLGGILLLIGIVFWLRSPDLPRSWLVAALVFVAVMAVGHLGFLYGTGYYPGRKLFGAVIGTPSIWPVLRFIQYSPVAGLIYAVAFLVALANFTKHRPLPMQVLFFVLAVWAPLLIVGYFAWYVPMRYVSGPVAYFLLCAFAGFAYLAKERQWFVDGVRLSRSNIVVLALVTVALVNPVTLARTVNPGYDRYPDHKGAAEFIKSLDLAPDAILIAEDVLQQTYYLGEVDYSLRPATDAFLFSFMRDGRMVDQYTGLVVLRDGEELEQALDSAAGAEVYIIGSGENFLNGERMFRTLGIGEVLESDRLEVVYEGRDGKTKVWKARW